MQLVGSQTHREGMCLAEGVRGALGETGRPLYDS